MSASEIIAAALEARTLAEANRVQSLIEAELGARNERPVGDKWNNWGLLSGGGGSFDHKIIEDVTNMQDAVVERAALSRFGVRQNVPYRNPRDAATDLFGGRDLSDQVVVEFYESDPPANISKRITAVFRDEGCGMTPSQVPLTIFGLGTSHKEDLDWLQGAFGMGGVTTYRNAQAVVVVTRRAPELLQVNHEDRITVAVVLWKQNGANKTAYYLVRALWQTAGDVAQPFSAPASAFPDFKPGTHVALISYGVEGFYRARGGGDDRTFEAVLNTRLFAPITAVKFRNRILDDRLRDADRLKGLATRLRDNPREDRREGEDTLPYNVNGNTYHLPVKFFVFSKPGEAGQRRKFVAYDHCVLFTSNGQVHYHWAPHQFRFKTHLSKLHDRILVVVETDELPIEVRNSLFTSDRQQLVRNDPAVRLEDEVAGFLDGWDELRQINGEIIREAIVSREDSRPTINIARQISRALTLRGFSLAGQGQSGGGNNSRSGGNSRQIELFPDPTLLEGPKHVKAEEGKTKFVSFILNTVDDFMPRRGQLTVTCDHPEIRDREITTGQLRAGRVRLSVAVPAGAQQGTFRLRAVLADWLRAAGGTGPTMEWTIQLEVVAEGTQARSGSGEQSGSNGGGGGDMVAVLWKSHETQEGWRKTTVGEVESVPATDLADASPEYAELRRLGDRPIPTLLLNKEFVWLKKYLAARAGDMSEDGLNRKRDQYAVGAGVGLCMLYQDAERRRAHNEQISEDWIDASQEAIARSVLSMMPAFDELAREAGLNDE